MIAAIPTIKYIPGVIKNTFNGKTPLSTSALVQDPIKINGIKEYIIDFGFISSFSNNFIIKYNITINIIPYVNVLNTVYPE